MSKNAIEDVKFLGFSCLMQNSVVRFIQITVKEPVEMSLSKVSLSPDVSEDFKRSIHYQVFYVKQGSSGHFRDSIGYEMLQRDVFAAQKELAKQISVSAISEDETD